MKTTLSFVRTNHDAHPPSQAKASHRQKSLCCSSETEIDLRGDIVTNASRYLGAMRSRQDEPAARSPSFAQLEQPGQQALSSTSVGISQWGGEIRIFASGGTKQGWNNHGTNVLDLARPGVHGGARAGIALLPTSRSPRSRVTLAFLWGEKRRALVGGLWPSLRFASIPMDRNKDLRREIPGSGRTGRCTAPLSHH